MLRARDGVRDVEAPLKDYLSRLSRRVRIESAVVVGSRARSDHWTDSDIDLVVVSSDFEGMPRADRIDLLLEDWFTRPSLEPMGYTPGEILLAGSLYLWDALADGKPLVDVGPWEQATVRFRERLAQGELERTSGGWRQSLDPAAQA